MILNFTCFLVPSCDIFVSQLESLQSKDIPEVRSKISDLGKEVESLRQELNDVCFSQFSCKLCSKKGDLPRVYDILI